MKSIKEKSFELFPEMQTDSDDWDVIEEQCVREVNRIAFQKGANYVLDKVEHILEDKELDIEETCDRLFALVKQLKK